MKNLLCKVLLIFVVLTAIFTVSVAADAIDGKFETYWTSPGVKPPGTHPSVFFTAEDIPQLRANLEAEENKLARLKLMGYVSEDISTSTSYSETKLAKIESCAYYYALYAETLDSNELEALEEKISSSIDYICSIKLDKATANYYSRDNGRCLSVLSELYDWCYPLIKDNKELIEKIIDKCIYFAQGVEPWNSDDYAPTNMYAIAGHGAEREFLRDLLSFSIAVYDERPDIWESVGGRFYEEYVPVNQTLLQSGYYHAGTDYGPGRAYATCCAYFLIKGMGADEPWSGALMSKLGYQELYTRRPDGNVIYDGDIYSDTIPPFTYKKDTAYGNMFMYAAAGNDPYLKGEQFRQDLRFTGGAIQQNFIDQSPVLYLMINNTTIEPKAFSDLPHSKYFSEPAGVMASRTGWEDGVDSDAVIATFKVNTHFFSDHLHFDCGHFNIYYKGLLAADSGNYYRYGDLEHGMYTIKSIAHNTMLVYNPADADFSEVDLENYEYNRRINDGGQIRNGSYLFYDINDFMEQTKNGAVMAQEIDPQNTQKPYYTYLKGDLGNAYSKNNVEEFKRSFMFLDLKDEEIPAALIVFDKVVSKDAKFKKMWLLHGLTKPIIDAENKISTFTNTETYGDVTYNGQMVVETLLPKNVDYDVVGGEDEGWGVVRGWEYNEEEQKWDITNSVNYGADTSEDKTDKNERNTYRMEISPKTPEKENHFLNVILIGDAGQEIRINAPLYEANNFYGTKVKDRVVFFSRDGAKKDSFSYSLTGSGEYRYTICDMESGEYTVTIDGSSKPVYVSEEGGVLSFTAQAGEIAVTKISDKYIAPEDAEYEVNDAQVYVMQENVFTKPLDIAEADSELSVSVTETAEALGYTAVSSEEKGKAVVTLYDGLIALATVREGDTAIITKGGTLYTTSAPFVDGDGKCMMQFSDLLNILFNSDKYIGFANTIFVHKTEKVPNVAYESAYVHNNKLYVNAKIYNAFSSKVFCALEKDGILLEAVQLTDKGNGCFEGSIEISDYSDYEVRLYTWGDSLYPLTDIGIPEEMTGITYYAMNNGLSYGVSHSNVLKREKSGEKIVVKRISDIAETAIYTKNSSLSEGIIHYSTNLRINKLFEGGSGGAEIMYFAVRGKIGSSTDVIRYYQPENFDGLELKIDAIVDMDNKMVYIYENGILANDYPVKVKWNTFEYFQHYITNRANEYAETEFELFGSILTQYPTGTDINKVINNIGKFVILE